MEKDFETVILLDTYAPLLTEKQQRLCDMYYNQDYSLAEIADIEKTSRQAARDGIAKARQKLRHYESCLNVCKKRGETARAIETLQDTHGGEAMQAMRKIADIWEIDNGV